MCYKALGRCSYDYASEELTGLVRVTKDEA